MLSRIYIWAPSFFASLATSGVCVKGIVSFGGKSPAFLEAVLVTSRHSSKHETYAALSESSQVPASTLWHREHGRPSKREVAAQKQYLTPSEEKALADYILRWAERGSPSGYSNTPIVLDWYRRVFDPQTKDRANHRPRILINDGFGLHDSLEVLQFCHENNIILCRLPSHTSNKLQPCDVAVFGLLKTAYRELVGELERGSINTIGKQHFTLLYDQARQVAFTAHNIKSAWAKTGLEPFDPNRVLQDI